LGAAITEN